MLIDCAADVMYNGDRKGRKHMSGAKQQEPYDFLIGRIISIARMDTHAGWRLTNLKYPDTWVFCCCISGKSHYEWHGASCDIGAGDAALFAPGLIRSATTSADAPWSFVVAKFHIPQMNAAARKILSDFPVYIPHLEKKTVDLFLKCESIWRGRRSTYLIACRSILEEIMTRLIQEMEEKTIYGLSAKRIKPAMRRLENGEDCTAEELAEMVGLSVSHFRMLFRQTTGYTVVQYKNYMRVSRARDLLLMRNYSVSEVAEAVGIPDLYYFSRLFKQYLGFSPSQVRNN